MAWSERSAVAVVIRPESEVAVVHRLERVDDDEELLTRIGFSRISSQCLSKRRDVIVLAADEAVHLGQADPLRLAPDRGSPQRC